ncbi:hypothetical protein [Parendozoicomonas sp. Alg238-R29]|uniref:hypothetical protein n=1 Tax=Parendozoicomonas sp. Alg238-R29 TaxID=2993446 RepID=UPI00248D9D89|nr:hypothetical protein [Parendozoicomonas sp. Alg238-R29]
MHQLKAFKKQRKDIKIRLKAAKREVKALEQELKTLRFQEQHKAADNLEYWLDKGQNGRVSLLARLGNLLKAQKAKTTL